LYVIFTSLVSGCATPFCLLFSLINEYDVDDDDGGGDDGDKMRVMK